MNEQKAPGGIEWTRIRNADGSVRRGYTWNPVGGCFHGCEWVMPDGSVAECYAKGIAEGLARAAYPDGFEAHYFNDSRLSEPFSVKEPAGIFLDSMSDLMGHWVLDHQLDRIKQVILGTERHIYQLLTKNAPRLIRAGLPLNVWLGVSSPPDWMWGKRLTHHQQEQMLYRALDILTQKRRHITWMSFEPLSWDVTPVLEDYPYALDWAVIGAASNGPKEYPPDEGHVRALVELLDSRGVPVFFKGNLRSLKWAADNWREDFPKIETKGNEPMNETVEVEVTPEDEVEGLKAALAAAEFKLQKALDDVEKAKKASALPNHNELEDLRKRLAAYESGSEQPVVVKGPECEFGYYPGFDKPEGRKSAGDDIAKRLQDGWEIAHEGPTPDGKLYIVRYQRGRRNNPHGTPLTGKYDQSELTWQGIMASQQAYDQERTRQRSAPPMVIQGTLLKDGVS